MIVMQVLRRKTCVSGREAEPLAPPLTRSYIAFFGKFIESLSVIVSGTPLGLAHFL